MSVKPIQDDIQVKEVGEQPKVDKSQINSQVLPLPPMTFTQLEEMVAGVVGDIIQPDQGSKNIEVSNLQPSAKPVEVDVIDTISAELTKISQSQDFSVSLQDTQVATPPVVPQQTPQAQGGQGAGEQKDPKQAISDIESMVADLLSKISSARDSSSSGGEGHTTRSFVDEVLGGTRNLEGEKLVEVANFLGEDEGTSFKQEEDGTFTQIQDGEVVAEGLSQGEANEWISDKERGEAAKSEDSDASQTTNQTPDSISTEATIIKDTDTSTAESRPFNFDPEYLILLDYGDENNTMKAYDPYEEIADLGTGDGYYFITCEIANGVITTSEFVNTRPSYMSDFASSPYDFCEFTGTGANRVQTKAHIPVCYPKLPSRTGENKLYFVNYSGLFAATNICEDGFSFIYPIRF